MPKETLTTVLQKAIRDSGLSMYAICKRTGIDKGQLSRFMAGTRDLQLTTADNLCKMLGLKLRPTQTEKDD